MKGEGKRPENSLYIALLHYPVYDKNGNVVTTCVTNLDLHDMARVARTYDLGRFFIVHPVPSQGALIRRIAHHWKEGFGARYNATRREAFESMTLCKTLDQAVDHIRTEHQGETPNMVVTAAGRYAPTIDFSELGKKIREGDQSWLLLFGTGWGLSEGMVNEADYVLEPVHGVVTYNHLSVRSAVSIIVDRLVGDRNL